MAGYSVLHSPLLGEEKVVMRPQRTGGDISRVSLGQVAKTVLYGEVVIVAIALERNQISCIYLWSKAVYGCDMLKNKSIVTSRIRS